MPRVFLPIRKSSGLLVSLVGASITATLLIPLEASSSGFGIFTQGAAELGMSNTVKAHTLGPASNFHNPALLTDIEGHQIEIGTTLISFEREFDSNLTGQTTDAASNNFFPSTLFGVYHVSSKASIGLGVYTPFGLGSEWPGDWEGRYITTSTDMLTVNINPNFAYAVTNSLSIALGVDIIYGDAELQQKINLMPYGLPDGEQNFEGDGVGYGFNLGLKYQFNDEWSLGLAYRSKVSLEIDGKANFGLPSYAPPTFGAIFPNTKGTVDIDLPQQAFWGIAYKATDNFQVEVGGRWEGWSSYDKLMIEFQNPVAGSSSITTPKDWEDTGSIAIGIKYDLSDTLYAVGGYSHHWNAIPDETFEPSVTDSDKDEVTIGFQKFINQFKIGASFAYDFYQDRKKNNSVGAEYGFPANGNYSQDSYMIALSLGYQF